MTVFYKYIPDLVVIAIALLYASISANLFTINIEHFDYYLLQFIDFGPFVIVGYLILRFAKRDIKPDQIFSTRTRILSIFALFSMFIFFKNLEIDSGFTSMLLLLVLIGVLLFIDNNFKQYTLSAYLFLAGYLIYVATTFYGEYTVFLSKKQYDIPISSVTDSTNGRVLLGRDTTSNLNGDSLFEAQLYFNIPLRRFEVKIDRFGDGGNGNKEVMRSAIQDRARQLLDVNDSIVESLFQQDHNIANIL